MQSLCSLLFGSLLVSSLFAPEPAECAEDDTAALRKVIRDWNRRQQMYAGARYVLDWKRTVPKGSLNGLAEMLGRKKPGAFPPRDWIYENKLTLVLDFAGGRSRQEWDGELLGENWKVQDVFVVHLSDGVHLQQFKPQQRNEGLADADYATELSNRRVEDFNTGFFFKSVAYPVFFAHGIIPTKSHPIVPIPLTKPVDAADFSVVSKVETEEGVRLVLHTTNLFSDREMFYELWVDPARGSAVTRCLSHLKGRINRRWDMEYRKAGENWIVSAWTEMGFRDGQLTESSRLRVVDFEANPRFEKNTFHREPSEGMFFTTKDGDAYQQRVPGEPPVPANVAMAEDRAAKERTRWYVIVTMIGVAVVAGLGAFYFVKWRKARHPAG